MDVWDLNRRERSLFQAKGRLKKKHNVVRRPLKPFSQSLKTTEKLGAEVKVVWGKEGFLISLLSLKWVFLASIELEELSYLFLKFKE